MSSSIEIRLKRKQESYKDALPLLWMTTTPTRELTSEVDLVYAGGYNYLLEGDDAKTKHKEVIESEYGYYTLLTNEKLEEIITFYTSEINYINEQIKYYKGTIQQFQELLVKATTVEIYERIQEDIHSHISTLSHLKEDLEEYQHYKNLWLYSVQKIYELVTEIPKNKDKFELIYYTD